MLVAHGHTVRVGVACLVTKYQHALRRQQHACYLVLDMERVENECNVNGRGERRGERGDGIVRVSSMTVAHQFGVNNLLALGLGPRDG